MFRFLALIYEIFYTEMIVVDVDVDDGFGLVGLALLRKLNPIVAALQLGWRTLIACGCCMSKIHVYISWQGRSKSQDRVKYKQLSDSINFTPEHTFYSAKTLSLLSRIWFCSKIFGKGNEKRLMA